MQSALDNDSNKSSINISLKMSISTSGEPHNGLLISTGIQTGRNNNFCTQNDNSIFYDSNGKNMLKMFQNLDKKSINNVSELKKPDSLVSDANIFNSKAVLNNSTEAFLSNECSNSLTTLLSPSNVQKNNLLDSFECSDVPKLQNNKTLTFTNNNNSTNLLENDTNYLKNISLPKPCLKNKSIDKSKLPPLPKPNKTKFCKLIFI